METNLANPPADNVAVFPSSLGAQKAKVPANEAERLRALADLDILDTQAEEVFDRVTRLAAHILDVPIALISLVDRDRQWFKSKIGIDVDETHRDLAFCSHAISDDDLLVVPDALEDPRFFDNPLVTGDPNIRFYVGAPLLLTDDIRLGTLCAIDRVPRQVTQKQRQALADLAAVAVDEMKLRTSVQELAANSLQLEQSVVELRLASEGLRQFAYMASHDLRAPLKKLVNLADLAILDSGGTSRASVQPLRDSAVRLEELVAGYGRLAGLQHGVSSEQLVSSLLKQAVAALGTSPKIKLVKDASIFCDPVLVSQMFLNLAQNARQYGADDELIVDTVCTGNNVLVSFSNAVPVPFAVDKSIFAPFRRLTADGDGQGLGLAIVDRIVGLHGGSVAASCTDHMFVVELSLPAEPTG